MQYPETEQVKVVFSRNHVKRQLKGDCRVGDSLYRIMTIAFAIILARTLKDWVSKILWKYYEKIEALWKLWKYYGTLIVSDDNSMEIINVFIFSVCYVMYTAASTARCIRSS